MANVVLKKDFANGDILYDVDLNNNFAVIEAGINANEENLQAVIDQAIEELDEQLEEITADRGWDWNGGDRVTFFKGTTSQVNNKEITDGQLLYNTETGETAMDDDGERIITGSGNVVVVSEDEPTNIATKEWIKPSEMVDYAASYVVDTMDGQATNQSPSVHASKEYINNIRGNILWQNPSPSSSFSSQEITLESNDYDMLELIWKSSASENFLHSCKIPKGYGVRMSDGYTSNFAKVGFTSRTMEYVNDTTYSFSVAGRAITSQNTYSEENTACVPLYIIGYKTGLFD